MEVQFRQRAYLDIENIIAWIISEGYPFNAFRFFERIISFCERLNKFPEKVTGDEVAVTRVFHTSRLTR